jgi:menaquinone-dependent protoporphyrinogen oxidase
MMIKRKEERKMEKHTLVTYASKAGSTTEIAERIAKNLSAKGLVVDFLPIEKVKDLTAYQSVVVGSAIRAGNLLSGAKTFILKHQSELQQKHFSLFIVCLTMKDDTKENCDTVSAYLEPIRSQVKPDKEGLFAGAINMRTLGFIERTMMKVMKATDGDYRDWDTIDTWSQELAQELSAQPERA